MDLKANHLGDYDEGKQMESKNGLESGRDRYISYRDFFGGIYGKSG